MNYFQAVSKEPYRLFFILGSVYLIWGALVWVPLIWNPGDYPVLLHRYLMLNGFTAYVMPDLYLGHLGYSALVLVISVVVWLIKFGRLCFVIK